MSDSERLIARRSEYIAEAKGTDLLNAVFLLYYFNTEVLSYAPNSKDYEIAPDEVFENYDSNSYYDALNRSRKLLVDCSRVGNAAFDRDELQKFEDEVKDFKCRNPGFTERAYGLAIEVGIGHNRW